MVVRVLSDSHYEEFMNGFANVKSEMKIITPFLSYQAINKMLQVIDKSVEITLVTRFKREDFMRGVSSLEALSLLLKREAKIFAVQDLHTKLYLFDSETAIVGSANLTGKGLKSNVELSMLFSDENEVTSNLMEYFLELQELSLDFSITENLIDAENIAVQKLVNNQTDKSVSYSNNKQWGAQIDDLNNITNEISIDLVQEQIKETAIGHINEESEVTYWLKFNGTGNDLKDPNKPFEEQFLADGTRVENFGGKPTGIKEGDILYITPLSLENKVRTPIIIGKCVTNGFEEGNVVTEIDKVRTGYEWMERWPYYVEVFDIQLIEGNISNGISLNKLLSELQNDFYFTTQGQHRTMAQLKATHHQKSKIRITPYAAKYIDKMLGFT